MFQFYRLAPTIDPPPPICPLCHEEWHDDGGCRDPECPTRVEMEPAQ